MNVRDFVPPIIRQLFSGYALSGVYPDYDAAVADSHTYEDTRVIDLVTAKTMAYKDYFSSRNVRFVEGRQTIQALLVFCHADSGRQLKILEIGGACGALYFEMAYFLGHGTLAWHVVETRAMAEAGRKHFETDQLRFFDSIEEATAAHEPDLIIASAVLPYVPDPIQSFTSWLSIGAKYVYVCRTPVGLGIDSPIITKQICKVSSHGPGKAPKHFQDSRTTQPMTILPQEMLLKAILDNYSLLYFFKEDDSQTIFIGFRRIHWTFIGLLLQRGNG